ncbi:MAG: hypothetical protein ACPGPE_15660, partial [Planctomycetota bacterium]
MTVHVGGGGQPVAVPHHEPRARRILGAGESNGDLRRAALDVAEIPSLHLLAPELRGEDQDAARAVAREMLLSTSGSRSGPADPGESESEAEGPPLPDE